ncbi:hypothetical protein KJ359_000647 [Pestalotiopsis sp. 9143b]|nr:hypothetical protein KJ359_000647 [Pestalotiopsis sp. 9143b]
MSTTPPPEPTGSEKINRKDSEHTEATRSEVERISSRSDSVEAGQPNISDNPNLDAEEKKRLEASAKLENPLAGLSQAELAQRGEEFSRKHGFAEEEDIRAFRLGAMIAGNMNKYDTVDGLTEREKDVLDREITHKWSNPTMLYAVIVICSLCAAVQGMDETVVNGAQIFYKKEFSIDDDKDTVSAELAQRTIFAAECSPPKLRGALVMQWQMWTAFGIMIGYVADLAFYFVPDQSGIIGLNWRLMMGSAGIPAVIVCVLIWWTPESPRWYLTKNRHADAYKAVCQLRYEKVQAARDLFYMDTLLQVEREAMDIGRSKVKELFTVRRNRNAMIASEIVMFMQQFCGVNAIAYYSTQIFIDASFPQTSALAASLGFGIINWLFALPAFYTIDTFGRRNLLLTTFPLMSIFLFFTGFSFWIPENSTAHIACIALGIYLFGIVYSPGEGSWTSQGAFSWYAAWNIVGWVLVLLFLPETKGKTLEELDAVFNVPVRSLNSYGIKQFFYFWGHYVLRRDIEPPKVPSALDTVEYTEKQFTREKQHEPSARV